MGSLSKRRNNYSRSKNKVCGNHISCSLGGDPIQLRARPWNHFIWGPCYSTLPYKNGLQVEKNSFFLVFPHADSNSSIKQEFENQTLAWSPNPMEMDKDDFKLSSYTGGVRKLEHSIKITIIINVQSDKRCLIDELENEFKQIN